MAAGPMPYRTVEMTEPLELRSERPGGYVKTGKARMTRQLVIEDVWRTPPGLFRQLTGEFFFNLDVCAIPENAMCSRFFTPDHDGLTQKWEVDYGRARCWMNP